MSLVDWLATRSDRCVHGWHVPTQGCRDCTPVAAEFKATSEWGVFKQALRDATRADASVHQCDVRPLIRGRIEPKHIGQLWRRARTEGLVSDTGEREPSNDTAGRNTDKLDRIYSLRSAA